MDMADKQTTEETLDAAIEASLNTPAPAGDSRDLRETIARLAAASPYMDPPTDLRGKILQATAPYTFRIEDYKKANRDTSRFYRWGLVAATLFLMAAAWYNLNLRSSFNDYREKVAVAIQENEKQVKSIQLAATQKDDALRALVDPNVRQIALLDRDKKSIGKLLVLDADSKKFMVVFPQEIIPPGAQITMTVMNNGKPEQLHAVAVGASSTTSFIRNELKGPLGKEGPQEVRIGDKVFTAGGF